MKYLYGKDIVLVCGRYYVECKAYIHMKGRKLIGLMSDLSKQLKKTCHTRRHNEILSKRSKYSDKDKTEIVRTFKTY